MGIRWVNTKKEIMRPNILVASRRLQRTNERKARHFPVRIWTVSLVGLMEKAKASYGMTNHYDTVPTLLLERAKLQFNSAPRKVLDTNSLSRTYITYEGPEEDLYDMLRTVKHLQWCPRIISSHHLRLSQSIFHNLSTTSRMSKRNPQRMTEGLLPTGSEKVGLRAMAMTATEIKKCEEKIWEGMSGGISIENPLVSSARLIDQVVNRQGREIGIRGFRKTTRILNQIQRRSIMSQGNPNAKLPF